METFKKISLTLLSITALLVALWIGANWRHLSAFPSILPSFYAKEYCSCYFVMERSEAACHDFARQWLKIDSFELDKDGRRVIVQGMGRQAVARYSGERTGCRLE
ncbi:MAG: hypothetical protein K1X75_13365 [Leptospirales bacterium]|nr:hypothetical protein [Leptospirales bacterium]